MSRENVLTPYLYLLPALAMLLGYMYVPLLKSVQYSFFEFREFRPDTFVGLTNYIHVFQDGLFWNSVSLTLRWVVMTALLPSISGLILALLIEYSDTGRALAGVTRTVLFMPMMMSLVAVGLLWMLIFNPNLGLINALLNALSITDPGHPVNLFGNTRYALFSAFIPVLWQGSGFAMVIFSAALQSLPLEIREASVIDGANKMRQIRSIVLPYIARTVIIVMTVNMIGGFKAFDLLKVLTAGGPASSTEITALYMYRIGFFSFRFGYSSAIAVILFVFVCGSVLGFIRVTDALYRRYEH